MSRVSRLPIVFEGQAEKASFAHIRSQMPVGQGGFHVGALQRLGRFRDLDRLISTRNPFRAVDFLYVYDCGSEPKRHVLREIRKLRAATPNRRLDLLALSHFDRDHICGTPKLLASDGGYKVDTIILPYVDAAERLIAFGQAVASSRTYGGRIDTFFVDMVVDPGSTLRELRPKRVIFVRAQDDERPLEGEPVPDFRGPDPEEPRERGKPPMSWRFKAQATTREVEVSRLPGGGGTEVLQVRNADVVYNDPSWSIVWKLRPYVRRADPARVAVFKSEIESLFGWATGTFDAQVKSPSVRYQMVTAKRTKVAKAYKVAFGDKNLISMSLYSGPQSPEELDGIAIDPPLPAHELTKVGWLGTGDAHLEKGAEARDFENAFAGDISHTSTFVFPHHGSIENTDPNRLISDADNWVAAADPIHDWDHPHYLLRVAVAARNAGFRHVRAPEATRFSEIYLFTPRDTGAGDPSYMSISNQEMKNKKRRAPSVTITGPN